MLENEFSGVYYLQAKSRMRHITGITTIDAQNNSVVYTCGIMP
jgi:hypothetical protein